MRKLENYVAKYGPEVGRKLFHLLQSQAAHAGVSARLRRKLEAVRSGSELERRRRASRTAESAGLPLFPEPAAVEG